MADDLGYGDLGYNGQQNIKTPRLDELASRGMIFTNHYSGNTVCAPSRASLMTGWHQGHSPVRGNKDNQLPAGTRTVANVLQDAGYRTGMMGKWGLGMPGTSGDPHKMGFDHYFGYLDQIHAHNFYPDHLLVDGDSLVLDNEIVRQTEGYAAGIGQASTNKKTYAHDLLIEDAMRFVRESEAAKEPFFLYVPSNIPHVNNEAHLVADHGMEVPSLGIYSDTDWPAAEKGKAAMITLLDKEVGRIVDLIDSLNLSDNTLIIFTSDNGPANVDVDPEFHDSNGDYKGIKRDLYEGGIHMPMFAVWPGKIAPGTRSDLLTAFWDYLPTFAAVAGAEIGEGAGTDGINFLPTLLGEEQPERHDFLYWEFSPDRHAARAVRKGDWKLVHDLMVDEIELYDLATDPSETNDLAAEEPAVVEELLAIMDREHTFHPTYPLPYVDEAPTE